MKYLVRRTLEYAYNHSGVTEKRFKHNRRKLSEFSGKHDNLVDRMPGTNMPMIIDPKMYLKVGYMEAVFEPECIYFLRDHLKKGDVFMDVGANVGYFSLFAAKRVGKTGNVFSFEPGEFAFNLLKQNRRINQLGWLYILNVGLGETDSITSFYCGEPGNDVYSSLREIRHPNANSRDFTKVSIQLLRGDNWCKTMGIDHVDLLKIDVEGAELSVLKGLLHMLKEKRIFRMMLEVSENMSEGFGYSPSHLCEFLEELEYRCFKLGPYGKRLSLKDKRTLGDGMIVAEI